jgi:hypothetical protein
MREPMSGTHDWIDNDTQSETDGMGLLNSGVGANGSFVVFSAAFTSKQVAIIVVDFSTAFITYVTYECRGR